MNQKDVWNDIASGFTHYRHKPIGEVIKFSQGKEGKILDIGCGNCRNLIPFKSQELYGIDFAPKMIEEAKLFCKKHDLNVILKVADAHLLPFVDNYFDVVVCLSVLHCIEGGREKVIREISRVLKPGGYALFSVWQLNEKGSQYIPWNKRDKKLMRYYYIFEKDEFVDLLKNNGLQIEKATITKLTNKSNRDPFSKEKTQQNIIVVCSKPLKQ